MSDNPSCTVYVGNLDEKVSERVLYDILIQAGRLVELYIPRDRETDKPKGYAFAEYETEEVAEYAVKLFSGLVTLYNRTLKFAISGRDKQSQNGVAPNPVLVTGMENLHDSLRLSTPGRLSAHPVNYPQVQLPSGLKYQHNGYGSHFNGVNYEYDDGRRLFGSAHETYNHSRSRR